MNITKNFVIMLLVLFGAVIRVSAAEIVEPSMGAVFHPGDRIRVVVRPAVGEKIISVGVGFEEAHFDNTLKAFVIDFSIPKNANPGKIEFKVEALTESKTVVTLTCKITVVLSQSIRLLELNVWPTTLILYKLPDSSANSRRKQVFETEDLSVGGMFSDGYTRSVTSSTSGTKYSSSNEGIVAVNTEGMATAKKAGRAKIVITNSGKEIAVDVIVKDKDH